MSRRILISLSFILFVYNLSIAKDRYVDCQMQMLNGKEKMCLIKLPMDATADKLVIKENANASKETIKADQIKLIIISNNGVDVIYERTEFYTLKMKKSKKLSKYKAFLKITGSCENARSYLSYAELDIDRHGNLLEMFIDGMGGQLLKKENEQYPCLVGYTFLSEPATQKMFDKQRKQMLEKYFEKDKENLEYVKSRSRFSEKDFDKLFNSMCE